MISMITAAVVVVIAADVTESNLVISGSDI